MSHSIGFYFSRKKKIAISKMFCLDFGLDYFFLKKSRDFEK